MYVDIVISNVFNLNKLFFCCKRPRDSTLKPRLMSLLAEPRTRRLLDAWKLSQCCYCLVRVNTSVGDSGRRRPTAMAQWLGTHSHSEAWHLIASPPVWLVATTSVANKMVVYGCEELKLELIQMVKLLDNLIFMHNFTIYIILLLCMLCFEMN